MLLISKLTGDNVYNLREFTSTRPSGQITQKTNNLTGWISTWWVTIYPHHFIYFNIKYGYLILNKPNLWPRFCHNTERGKLTHFVFSKNLNWSVHASKLKINLSWSKIYLSRTSVGILTAVTELSSIAISDFGANKSARVGRFFVIIEFVVSGTQCNNSSTTTLSDPIWPIVTGNLGLNKSRSGYHCIVCRLRSFILDEVDHEGVIV